jgi:porphobilinogen synthase
MNKPSCIAETHRLDLGRRPRRNRKAEWARRLVAEPILATNDLIWPRFHIDGEKRRVPLATMPDSGVSPKLAILPALR